MMSNEELQVAITAIDTMIKATATSSRVKNDMEVHFRHLLLLQEHRASIISSFTGTIETGKKAS